MINETITDRNRTGEPETEAAGRAGHSRLELLGAMPTRSRRREIWVGVFVLAGVFSALFALFTLTDAATFRGRYIVTTMVDNAGGIRKGDPVQMRGVNIGRVQRFDIGSDGVAVRLELEGEYPVPRDSRVALKSSGLLGGMVAEIVAGTAEERLRGGDLLPGARADGLFDAAGEMGAQATNVLGRVEALLSDQTVNALGAGAEELHVLLRELRILAETERAELVALTRSLKQAAAGLEGAVGGPELARVVARLDSLSASAAATTSTLEEASASLQTVLARMERGEGTLGRLSADDALYRNLNQAAENLDLLLQDVRQNPRRYINLKIF